MRDQLGNIKSDFFVYDIGKCPQSIQAAAKVKVKGEQKNPVLPKTVLALEGEPFVLGGCPSHSL